MDRLLAYVFAGSRGGAARTRIVASVLDEGKNTHQIAKELGMDYKTIEYNLRVLSKHRFVVSGEGYGKLWEPSKNLRASEPQFRDIMAKLKVGKPTNSANLESSS